MTKPSNRGDKTTACIHKALIEEIIKTCRDDFRSGLDESEIRLRLADHIKTILPRIHPIDFVEWIRDDAQYSFYFYDALSSACYKPSEMVAAILETIAIDSIDG